MIRNAYFYVFLGIITLLVLRMREVIGDFPMACGMLLCFFGAGVSFAYEQWRQEHPKKRASQRDPS